MKKTLLCVLFAGCILHQADAQDIREWKDINYAGDTLTGHRMDIYLPAEGNGPFPVIVTMAGSRWTKNNTKDWAYNSGILGKNLHANGFAIVAVDHRSSLKAIFPAQINDIKAVVRFIRGNAEKYHFDTRFIGITGNSSGGHLASLMGTSGGVGSYTVGLATLDIEGNVGDFEDQSSHVDAVVSWRGPSDFLVMDSCGSKRDPNGPESGVSIFVGGPIQENKDLCALANPITYIDKNDPAFLIFGGDEDTAVPPCQAEILHEALQSHGVQSRLVIMPESGHVYIKRPDRTEYINEMISFFSGEYAKKSAE